MGKPFPRPQMSEWVREWFLFLLKDGNEKGLLELIF